MEEIKDMVSKYKIGDIVEGDVTGMVDFGIFIKIDDNLEGLAHISELDWSLIEKPSAISRWVKSESPNHQYRRRQGFFVAESSQT